jgi:hypothetical protein
MIFMILNTAGCVRWHISSFLKVLCTCFFIHTLIPNTNGDNNSGKTALRPAEKRVSHTIE